MSVTISQCVVYYMSAVDQTDPTDPRIPPVMSYNLYCKLCYCLILLSLPNLYMMNLCRERIYEKLIVTCTCTLWLRLPAPTLSLEHNMYLFHSTCLRGKISVLLLLFSFYWHKKKTNQRPDARNNSNVNFITPIFLLTESIINFLNY